MSTARIGVLMKFIFHMLAAVTAAPLAAQAAQRDGQPDVDAESPGAFAVGVMADGVSVDGRLDEAGWIVAPVVTLPFEVAPGENVRASVRTECRLAHDGTRLYLGCTAEDPRPADIRAYVTDRDAVAGQDRIVLTIDPFADARRGFEFGVTALGVQWDAVLAQQSLQQEQGNSADASWDAIWEAAGRIGAEGYVVEVAIPFRSLRFPRGADRWRFYLTRYRPRARNEEFRSVELDRGDTCVLCQSAGLTGFAEASPGVAVQLAPTYTARRADVAPADGATPLKPGAWRGEAGLDGLWSIAPSLTLAGTLNPDFSQVEADVPQLEANTRFTVLHPEKRPFFLEGGDLFATPVSALVTRTISDPVAGAKLTGKVGAEAVGLLVARDRGGFLILPGSQGSSSAGLEGGVTTGAVRLRRDLGASSTVGVLATAREAASYHNRAIGTDALLRPLPQLVARVQYLHAFTRYPDSLATAHGQPAGEFDGGALQASVSWAPRDWSASASYLVREKDLRLDAGFEPRSDVRSRQFSFTRRFWGDGRGWFERVALSGGLWLETELDGGRLGEGKWVGFEYDGPRQLYLRAYSNFDQTVGFRGREFGTDSRYVQIGARPIGGLGLSVSVQHGDGVDFATARPARELTVWSSFDVRVGRHLELRGSHAFQRLRADGADVLRAGVAEGRAVYSFTPRTFLRATMQHRTTTRRAAASDSGAETDDRDLGIQLLYAYKVNPQTVLFLGYATRYADTGVTPSGLSERSRAFFMKLGYAWRP